MNSAKAKGMQAQVTSFIQQLGMNIAQLEAEIQQNQQIYDNLAQEINAKLEQRIKAAQDGVQIKPYDLQAANLATDQKIKVLEGKLHIA